MMANSCKFNAFYCEICREIFKVGPSACLLGVRHLLLEARRELRLSFHQRSAFILVRVLGEGFLGGSFQSKPIKSHSETESQTHAAGH